MDSYHGGDNKMANTPAEIYANVRNRALEEAAKIVEDCSIQYENTSYEAAEKIRALKRESA